MNNKSIKSFIERLEAYRTLNVKGWDSYDAYPIDSKIVDVAISLVNMLSDEERKHLEIFPSTASNITFEFSHEVEKGEFILSAFLEFDIRKDCLDGYKGTAKEDLEQKLVQPNKETFFDIVFKENYQLDQETIQHTKDVIKWFLDTVKSL